MKLKKIDGSEKRRIERNERKAPARRGLLCTVVLGAGLMGCGDSILVPKDLGADTGKPDMVKKDSSADVRTDACIPREGPFIECGPISYDIVSGTIYEGEYLNVGPFRLHLLGVEKTVPSGEYRYIISITDSCGEEVERDVLKYLKSKEFSIDGQKFIIKLEGGGSCEHGTGSCWAKLSIISAVCLDGGVGQG
jgi:hypothetical protein